MTVLYHLGPRHIAELCAGDCMMLNRVPVVLCYIGLGTLCTAIQCSMLCCNMRLLFTRSNATRGENLHNEISVCSCLKLVAEEGTVELYGCPFLVLCNSEVEQSHNMAMCTRINSTKFPIFN